MIISKQKNWDAYITGLAVFLLSASLLMLEILFTRVSKVSFGNDFKFILLSFAILGIGAGGMLVYFFIGTGMFRDNFGKILQFSTISYSLLLLTPFLILHYFTDDQPLAKLLFFISTLLVYLVWGVSISMVFTSYTEKAALLYFFSMTGSAFGAFIVVSLLDAFGASKTIIAAFFISFLSVFLFNLNKKANKRLLFLLFLFFVAFSAVLSNKFSAYSDIVCHSSQKPKFSDTNSFSQIDMYDAYQLQQDGELFIPATYVTLDEILNDVKLYGIGIDCSGRTTFIEFKPEKLKLLEKSVKIMPYTFRNYSNGLIIGSGAGIDVVMSVLAGVDNITAVEINPLIIGQVEKITGKNESLDIYNHKSVDLVIGEARNFVLKSNDKFDLIFIPGSKRYGGSGLSSYAFLENYLYTQEAFESYFEHLNDDGVVAVSDFTWFVLRYLDNGIFAMKRQGIDVENRIALISGDPGSTVILKKSPFTIEEREKLKAASDKHKFDILFLGPKDIASYGEDAIIITDDHPFYWNKYSAINLLDKDKIKYESFLSYKNERFNSLDHLFILFFLMVSALLLFALLPFSFSKSKNPRAIMRCLCYFSCIGLGFIIFELTLIQKFTIFVENPVYSLSIILSAILFFGGIGSYFTPLLSKKFRSIIPRITGILALIMLLYAFALTPLLSQFYGFGIPFKIILSVLLVAMPSFFMGMFFPFGLMEVNKCSNKLVPWMWGINGVASALGGVLSMIIALFFGFNTALAIGVAFYILAAAAIRGI